MSVSVEHLHFSYGSRPVLQDITFTAGDGQLLAILGSNGVGKSTLFRCMLGLLTGYEGQVTVQGVDTRGLSARKLARLVAYIPQNSMPAFHYSVEDIVLMGTTAALSPLSVPGKNQLELVTWALEELEIAHLRKRCFHHLSGGERQLTILARALVQQTKLLMLDEPTASLDPGNRFLVMQHLKRLTEKGYTVIQTTHDPEQAYLFADHILALHNGSILLDGTPQQVLTDAVISTLYGADFQVAGLQNDRIRVCFPKSLL